MTLKLSFTWLVLGFALGLLGCRQSPSGSPLAAAEQPSRSVAVVKPERQTIRREVGQPGRVQAFEHTPIVAKVPGYVLKWNVDIGDPVKGPEYDSGGKQVRPGTLLAELWVPELVSELKLKEEQVQQAKKALAMVQAQVATAQARVAEAEAGQTRAEANNSYWKSQSARFTGLVKENLLDKQTQEETLNQFRAAAAALAEAQAKVQSAHALQQEKESARDKAEVDIRAADADRQRQADLVGYATLTAPYDGVVTEKNIATKQFVQPATGARADVLYVVERTDVVRVFVSVPEVDADWVHVNAPATVRVQALQGEQFKAKVTRTAWSLNQTTRTLLAEIDLPNPETPKSGRRLRPGMYAYVTIEAEWPDVLTLPASAIVTEGDVNVGYQSFCFLVENGRVKRTPVELGARNEQLVGVLKKRLPGDTPRWETFTGSEEVARGDLTGLKDGQAVEVKEAGK